MKNGNGINYIYSIKCHDDQMSSNGIENNVRRRSLKFDLIKQVKDINQCELKCIDFSKNCIAFNYLESTHECELLQLPLIIKINSRKTKSKLMIPSNKYIHVPIHLHEVRKSDHFSTNPTRISFHFV